MPTREDNASLFGTMIPALITLYQDDGGVDYDATLELAEKLVANGADGLVITGTTGESSTLEDEERLKLYELMVKRFSPDVKIIAGSTSNHTSHAVELSREAARLGVDAILVVTPYYNKPTQAGVRAHVEAIADATGLPIMLYDIPGRSGIPMTTETIIELAKNPLVAALKDAKGNLAATSEVLEKTDLAVYAGDDGATLPLMALGGSGVVSVSAHLAPAGYRALVDAMTAGDLEAARRAHFALEPIQRAAMTHVPGAVAVKTILQETGVIENASVRLPWVPASDEEKDLILADYQMASEYTL